MTIQAIQTTLFDVAELDPETRIVVQQEDKEYDRNMGEAGANFLRACHNLKRIREALHYKHPGFVDYCNSKSGLSQPTAWRMISVAKMLFTVNNISAGPNALYLLASPSTPDSARIEAIDRADAGEPITHQLARDIVSNHRNSPIPFVPDEDDEPLSPYEQQIAAQYQPLANHQLINVSTNNEWYTPRPFLDAAHAVMGGVDLDPASNALANKAVRAEAYYTIDEDGYSQPWEGRVWLNPPYGAQDGESNQARWSRRLVDEYRAGNVSQAILLVNAVPGNVWFAPLKDFPICFPDGRIRFYNADVEAGQPTHSNALVYFGPNVADFVRVFSQFGAVMARIEEYDGHVFIHGTGVNND